RRRAASGVVPGGVAAGGDLGAVVDQTGRRVDDRALFLQVDVGDDLLDERHVDLAAVGALHDEEVLGGQVGDLGDPADLGAVHGHHVEVDQLVVVVLVLVLGAFVRVDLGDEEGVAEGFGGGAVAHALEAQQQASAVDPAGLDGQRPGRGRVGGQDGAGAEAELRLVGADLDGDLALDAVGAADACDYQLHGA